MNKHLQRASGGKRSPQISFPGSLLIFFLSVVLLLIATDPIISATYSILSLFFSPQNPQIQEVLISWLTMARYAFMLFGLILLFRESFSLRSQGRGFRSLITLLISKIAMLYGLVIAASGFLANWMSGSQLIEVSPSLSSWGNKTSTILGVLIIVAIMMYGFFQKGTPARKPTLPHQMGGMSPKEIERVQMGQAEADLYRARGEKVPDHLL